MMLKSKLSTVPESSPIVNVKVAATTEPADNVEFSLSQVKVSMELAELGFQSDVINWSVSVVLPVFFT
jgi:hypothetical protein